MFIEVNLRLRQWCPQENDWQWHDGIGIIGFRIRPRPAFGPLLNLNLG
jgi:hypothetical protein